MTTVALHNFPCFNTPRRIEQLNRLLTLRREFMPHEVAAATGCPMRESTAILMLLHMKGLAEAYVVVYHRDAPDESYFMKRRLLEGLPKPPLVCTQCDEELTNTDQLLYDFSFQLLDEVVFTIDEGAH